MKEIVFTNVTSNVIPEEFSPKPARHFLPDWYKNTESYITGKKTIDRTKSPQTIKKCIPVLDALTSGYIIATWTDIYVQQLEDDIIFMPKSPSLEFGLHPLWQASKHPLSNGQNISKFINPWSIKTPKGHSCLFTEPLHNPNPYFTALDGIVDTDIYTYPVNFPLILKDPSFEGLIPAGTPIVQVIPFKRDNWKMKLGGEKESHNAKLDLAKVNSKWFDGYKKLFWSKKSYN
jgi:hypothetical protein